MTAGEALERAEELRPGCGVGTLTRMQWLRELDGLLRRQLFELCQTEEYDAVGADLLWDDGLRDEAVLLAPAPFDALYPHWLCAQIDAALGETDRYAGERAQYNTLVSELAVWLRRRWPPRGGAQWRW